MIRFKQVDPRRESIVPLSEKEIQDVFFAAMCDGYASEVPKISSIQELPDSKVITFVDGPFKIVDTYFVNENTHYSAGLTLIYHEGKIVWFMSYAGLYDEPEISFLKQALLMNYRRAIFHGGRGPEYWKEEDGAQRCYRNHVSGNFAHFSGKETIADRGGAIIGGHEYHGRLLI